MTWQQLGKYVLQTECGRWRISKAWIRDWARYSLWRQRDGNWVLLEVFDSAAEAMAACEAEAME